jgi:two-component system sensor histidine kinase PhoQ
MKSMSARLLLAAALVLALFVLLTSLALEQAFDDAARSAREERLLAQLYLLMAAAEVEDGTLIMPSDLAESRLSLPNSGLSARIFDAAGAAVWQSRSAINSTQPATVQLAPGARRFYQTAPGDEPTQDPGYLVAAFGVRWATGQQPLRYTFAVAEDLTTLQSEVARFRASLWRWLGVMALLMLAALLLALRWGLAPLRRVAAEVSAVESGSQARIRGDYPVELQPLTDNLNALLAHEQARQRRLDHALGDLAHSLKTPLAIMHGAMQTPAAKNQDSQLMREQLARVGDIVEYQLQRARAGAAGSGQLAPSVLVRRTAERIIASLDKVYRNKRVETEVDIEPTVVFRGAEADLMELLGNLLDNAFKWCRAQVRIKASSGSDGLRIQVEDDGPGIDAGAAERLLERGARADESAPGHGIGLAVVREISKAYGGSVEIGPAALGGALVSLTLGDQRRGC